jgi:hypothetical protein
MKLFRYFKPKLLTDSCRFVDVKKALGRRHGEWHMHESRRELKREALETDLEEANQSLGMATLIHYHKTAHWCGAALPTHRRGGWSRHPAGKVLHACAYMPWSWIPNTKMCRSTLSSFDPLQVNPGKIILKPKS